MYVNSGKKTPFYQNLFLTAVGSFAPKKGSKDLKLFMLNKPSLIIIFLDDRYFNWFFNFLWVPLAQKASLLPFAVPLKFVIF